ncbi:MAG: TIGR02302 family protein [Alphaproteobacteria bacterium]|nr:TIGR02302 family protein [Alphaproteobacteria bacterium]
MTAEFDEKDIANQPNGLPRPVRMRVGLSWGVLAAERVWPALWPASGIVGVFLILALANVFSVLPEWLHLTLLFGFIAAIIGAIVYSLRDAVFPTRAHALRRLEVSSGLTHRPLTALEDHPAVGDNEDTGRLWRAHRLQIVRRIHDLKVKWPHLSLTERDPYALRVLLVLVLLAMLIANWSDVPRRLQAALSPGFAQGRAPATFEAWVMPPAYTGEAPRHLTALARPTFSGSKDIINVPAGSVLTVRTHGETNAVLRLGALGHSVPDPQRLDFVAAGGDARDGKVKILKDMSVRLTLSTVLASHWRFHAIPDQPPEISFKTPIAVTQSQSLRFNYQIKDDYGVTDAKAYITLESPARRSGELPATIVFDLPLPPAPARQGEVTIFKDLTAHVWAGLPVVVTLKAKDERGQIAQSKPMRITLPEHKFTNALARALVEQRKSLARDPSSAPIVAKAIDALSVAPERFMPDVRNYLALRTVYFIASRAKGPAEIVGAQQLLWDLAMRIEEGDAPQAQAELRAVQQKLMDALARGASDDEIAQLMAQLRAAIERTMKAMAAQAQSQGASVRDPNVRMIRPQDLQQMLDSIQNLARQGSRAAAQQLLSQLQNMLENMQAMGSGAMSPEQKATSEALEKLGDMIGQQRGLMDKTFREQTAREDPERGGSANPQRYQQLSGEQSKLGQQLSQMLKQLGHGQEVPDALKGAQRSMAQAAEDLAQGRLGQAGESQQKAIDQLRRGGQAVAQQLMQQMARQGGMMNGVGPGSGENEDPFGRPQASYGPSYGESVHVPDKMDIQRAREILEELQRRAAERGRPTYELDYLDRLLRRF